MDRFYPGKEWLDTNGKKIEAHGGSVLYWEGKYYWYGENKEKTTGRSDIWTYGIKCYSSGNLYDWKDEGFLIPPSSDPASPLYPTRKIDRPHLLYCEKEKKFICWLKIMNDDGSQSMTILSADSLLGQYEIQKVGYKPFGFNAGDFDLFKDKDGTGYICFDKVHSELIVAELSDDYMSVRGAYSSHFPHTVPFTREAPACFERNGEYYVITSGTTGYFPNPSEAAAAQQVHGPYRLLNNPHRYDTSETSFHTQISSVFKVHDTELYIACADRWLPGFMNVPYAEIKDMFCLFMEGKTEEAAALKNKLSIEDADNTSEALYVWLPVRFENGNVYIDWLDEWQWEDYVGK